MRALSSLLLALFLLGGGTGCSTLPSSPRGLHRRFWTGYQRTDLKDAEFESLLNREFFPLFPPAVQHGLVSYLPVLPVRGHPGDPAEFALVTYQSQQRYEQFRQTDLGKMSADAHWKLFQKSTSHSVVAEPYSGQVQVDHAYEVHPEFREALSTTIVFAYYLLGPDSASVDELTQSIEHNHGASRKLLQDIVFLVHRDFVVEYLFLQPDADLSAFLTSLNASQVINLRSGVPGVESIHEGQGLKAKF